ncbi:MAG: hypothetical protein PF569_03830 [Candidatus Woesearchaeota archaeon]|jgi:hypothetical protein|nr:hypothetical protein [Candidatus Woesearchaeota archaeon]
MKYEIREDKDKKAIFDESGKQISDWWDYIWVNGLVSGESDFYIAISSEGYEAIFHKSGVQASDWWEYIWHNGLVGGTSNEYTVDIKNYEIKTLTFDKIKFIVSMLKGKLK